jgi:hypothetical protein
MKHDLETDGDGLVVAWHSGDDHLDASSITPFLHAGTLEQARMRGGRRMTRLVIRFERPTRLVDRSECQWRRRRLVDAARRGAGVAIYLNRYEGIPLASFETARREAVGIRPWRRLDALPDRHFRRLIPEAADSLIVLDTSLVVAAIACGMDGTTVPYERNER